MRKFIVNLSLFLVCSVISVIVLEALVRKILPVYDPSGMLCLQYYPDQDLVLCPKNFTGRQWKNTGDYDAPVNINRFGFRDKKDFAQASADDLFAVGDSFCFGWGVEEQSRYSDQVGKILGVTVYNIGSPSADIEDYKKIVAYAIANGAHIKNLVISVCMENDLRNYDEGKAVGSAADDRRALRSYYARSKPALSFDGIKMWLSKKSALYLAFSAIAHENKIMRNFFLKAKLIRDNYDDFIWKEYPYPEWEKKIFSSAKKIVALTKPYNSVVVIVPDRGLWVRNYGSPSRVHNRFVSLLREEGIKVVDLRPFFEESGDPLQYYFKQDGHWNAKGHLKAAEVVSAFLAEDRKLYNPVKNSYN